ncbi:MAG: AIR synthase-related protein [Fidelibacterota bacterium]
MRRRIKKKYELSELDKKYFRYIMSRAASEEELDIIAKLHPRYLRGRTYTETLNRLDDGAKRTRIPELDLTNHDGNHAYFFSDIEIIKNKKEMLESRSSLMQIQTGDKPYISLTAVLAQEKPKRLLKSEVYFQHDLNYKINHSAGMILTDKPAGIHLPPPGSHLLFLEIDGAKLNASVLALMKDVIRSSFVYGTRIVDKFGPAQAVASWCAEDDIGLTCDMSLFDYSGTGLLIAIQEGKMNAMKKLAKKCPCPVHPIGDVIKKEEFIIRKSAVRSIVFPLDILKFPWRVYSQTPLRGETPKINTSLPEAEDPDLPGSFLTLWNAIKDIREGNPVLIVHPKKANDGWAMSVARPQATIPDHPRLAGQLAVAQSMRDLACSGYNPKGMLLSYIFPEDRTELQLWQANEIIQGQEEAVRSLNIPILKRDVIISGDNIYQGVFAVGHRANHQTHPVAPGFTAEGDFISILGSHRAELGYSKYIRLIHDSHDGRILSCDLNMETRIQETVLQGIQAGLIKSAVQVEEGGLSVAIAKSLVAGKPGLGARIHFSRKLRPEEMLFGETQGLVLISLDEENIMEFERICMTIGVPSTTIGRITDNQRLVFNDLLDIAVTDL